MKIDEARGLEELEKENKRLKRLLVEAELDKEILKEAIEASNRANRAARAEPARRAAPSGEARGRRGGARGAVASGTLAGRRLPGTGGRCRAQTGFPAAVPGRDKGKERGWRPVRGTGKCGRPSGLYAPQAMR